MDCVVVPFIVTLAMYGGLCYRNCHTLVTGVIVLKEIRST